MRVVRVREEEEIREEIRKEEVGEQTPAEILQGTLQRVDQGQRQKTPRTLDLVDLSIGVRGAPGLEVMGIGALGPPGLMALEAGVPEALDLAPALGTLGLATLTGVIFRSLEGVAAQQQEKSITQINWSLLKEIKSS